jgi:hypothetical protein
MLQQMPENARTFYQTLDGQVEQNKIYTKLAIPKLRALCREIQSCCGD